MWQGLFLVNIIWELFFIIVSDALFLADKNDGKFPFLSEALIDILPNGLSKSGAFIILIILSIILTIVNGYFWILVYFLKKTFIAVSHYVPEQKNIFTGGFEHSTLNALQAQNIAKTITLLDPEGFTEFSSNKHH